MRTLIDNMLNTNRRIYAKLEGDIVYVYAKVNNLTKDNSIVSSYADIHELVKDLRKDYLVNYLKDVPNTVLIRNLKK